MGTGRNFTVPLPETVPPRSAWARALPDHDAISSALRLNNELWDANSFREQDGCIMRFGIQLAASGEYGRSTRWMQEYHGALWARLGDGQGNLPVPNPAIQFAARPNQDVVTQVDPANP